MSRYGQSWTCNRDHYGEVSCSECGWTLLEDTVFVDAQSKRLDLITRVNESYARDENGATRLKVTSFWLQEASTPKTVDPAEINRLSAEDIEEIY